MMTEPPAAIPRRPLFRYAVMLCVILFLSRLVLLIWAPHTDPSESRYAEIARKMVETGDWITLQFDYGVPFWAKPPLSVWMSALGMELFGVNEFGSRIFIFLAAILLLGAVARFSAFGRTPTQGWMAAGILLGMPLFFYCSAAVMTDLALLLGTTLAMTCFHMAVRGEGRRWGYGFFLALGIGLLAKGPLALVIAGMPIGLWTLCMNRWKDVWRRLPWLTGTLVMLAIAVPWYVLAERKTPGFIDYFIVGEHWKRFTVKGWTGDLYGHAHATPLGYIWVFWLAGTFPWCLGFFGLPRLGWQALRAWAVKEDGRGFYLIVWALCPLLFFTPARNIIATYPLPALPAAAMLLAEIVMLRASEDRFWKRWHAFHPALLGMSALVVVGAITVTVFPQLSPKPSQREVVECFKQKRGGDDQLVYYGPRKYSAEFYMEGMVECVKNPRELDQKVASPGRLYLAIPVPYLFRLPPATKDRFELVQSWQHTSLYVERDNAEPLAGMIPSTSSSLAQ